MLLCLLPCLLLPSRRAPFRTPRLGVVTRTQIWQPCTSPSRARRDARSTAPARRSAASSANRLRHGLEVRRKVEELGLIRKSRPKAAQVKGETPQLQTQTYAPPAPSELANS